MTDPSEINVDDLVTQDDLEDAIEGAVENAIEGVNEGDTDGGDDGDEESFLPDGFDPETDLVDPEAARDVADTTFIERMRHLAFDDCETEECNRLREKFGLEPHDNEGDGADADAGESEDTDANEGNDESSDDGDQSDSEPNEGDESESESESEGEGESVETNVFGEPV